MLQPQSAQWLATQWTVDELVGLVRDCAANGTKAVSFGGGEPLQYEGVFDLLKTLDGLLCRSMTSNGLRLEQHFDELVDTRPDKVHLSIHFPQNEKEVDRVVRQAHQLSTAGITSGINLLVAQSNLKAAETAAKMIRESGIGNERIVYLPMRSSDTPTPKQIAQVAGMKPFQSMTCLSKCGKSERFCSVGWNKMAAWCSYTESRRALETLDFDGLMNALEGLDLEFCGAKKELVTFVRPKVRGNLMTQKENQTPVIRDAFLTGSTITNTQPKVDYPAAHSMDSTWFAVDAEGNIAKFETGEAGAAPDSAHFDHGSIEPEQIAEMLAQSDYVVDFEDLIVKPDGNIYTPKRYDSDEMVRYNPDSSSGNEYSCLFWLKDESFFPTRIRQTAQEMAGDFSACPRSNELHSDPPPRCDLGFCRNDSIQCLEGASKGRRVSQMLDQILF